MGVLITALITAFFTSCAVMFEPSRRLIDLAQDFVHNLISL